MNWCHQTVRLRGGPLDGEIVHFSPYEFNTEIRVTGTEDRHDRSVIAEHFYQVVAVHDGHTRTFVAEFVKTNRYDMPLEPAPAPPAADEGSR
jgi:hypothetical protein